MKILAGLTDQFDPEVKAMLAAKYSRDVGSIEDRLPDSDEGAQKHKESLGKFYVGYGHKSVGQLAVTDLYLEGVSLLAAKAIENTPLFNGQESSTRYIDFTNQPMISSHPEITEWQEMWREFYLKAIPITIDQIKQEFPFEAQPEGTKQNVWENTIKARAFDICRGFLPAGVTTNVCFSGTFDTLNDHFGEMLFHPCQEMKDIAKTTIEQLGIKYPYAIVNIEKHLERNSFIKDNSRFFYQHEDIQSNQVRLKYDVSELPVFTNRLKFQKLPRFDSSNCQITLEGLIDFGSYRDLQRHRPGYMNMPVLSINKGFNKFYLDSLPESLKSEFDNLNNHFKEWFFDVIKQITYGNTDIKHFELQYAVPIGYNVSVVYKCDINQAMYLFELRSSKTVHQTLRFLVHEWVNQIKNVGHVFEGIDKHVDMDKDNFSLKRGTQTFGV
jgi:thymidylate synthase ThyX